MSEDLAFTDHVNKSTRELTSFMVHGQLPTSRFARWRNRYLT
jgi:hypothetical protein